MTQFVLNSGHQQYLSGNTNYNCGINPILAHTGTVDGHLTCYEIKRAPSSGYNAATDSSVANTLSAETNGAVISAGLNRFAPRNKHDKNAYLENLETTSSNKIRSSKVVGSSEATGTMGYNLSTGHYQFTDVSGVQRIINSGDCNVGFSSDSQISGNSNSILDVSMYDYFVVINTGEPKNHHVAKITKLVSFDYTGDGFEFSPSYGANVPKGAKFAIYRGAYSTDVDVVAVGYGLADTLGDADARNSGWVGVSSPSFYFYNKRLQNKNQLDYATKYQVNTSRWFGSTNTELYVESITLENATTLRLITNATSQSAFSVSDNIQNTEGVVFGVVGALGVTSGFVHIDVTIPSGLVSSRYPYQYSKLYKPDSATHEKTVFMTKGEYSPTKYSDIISDVFVSQATAKDSSPFNMNAKIYDELEMLDKSDDNNLVPTEANSLALGTDSTYTRNYSNWTDCFRNYKTSLNGKLLSNGGDGEGVNRYLYYRNSPDRGRIINNLIDYEVSQEYTNSGNHANVTVVNGNDLSKIKTNHGDDLEVRSSIHNGEFSSKFDALIEGRISSVGNWSITVLNEDTDYDYNIVLGKDPYEQIKIADYYFTISNITQSITAGVKTTIIVFDGWRGGTNEGETNSSFTSITGGEVDFISNEDSLVGSPIYRTAWSSICANLILKNEDSFESDIVYADTDAPYLGGETPPAAATNVLPLPTGSYAKGGVVSTKLDDIFSECSLVLASGYFSDKRLKIKFSDRRHRCIYLENVREVTPDPHKPDFTHAIQGFLKHESGLVNGIYRLHTPVLLDFYEGKFLIERTVFEGTIKNIENGTGAIPQTSIFSVDKSAELLNVKINNSLKFTEDYIYTTNSPVKNIIATQYKFCGHSSVSDPYSSSGQIVDLPSGWVGHIYLMNAESSPTLFKFDIGQHLYKPDGSWIGEITEVVEAVESSGKFFAIKIGRGTQCIITTSDRTRFTGSNYITHFGMINGSLLSGDWGVVLTDWAIYVNADYQTTAGDSGFTFYNATTKPTGNAVVLGNALAANPFQSNRLTALTSCADKGAIFTGGKELIRTSSVTSATITLSPSASVSKTTTVESTLTRSDLHSTSSDSDLESLGYYINNPISISNNKDLEFMFKLSHEEIENTFSNISYKNKRTVSSLSEYEVLSVESVTDKKGLIKIAPICPLILARVDLNVEDRRLMDEIPLWQKQTTYGGGENLYLVGENVTRTINMGNKFGGYFRLSIPLDETDMAINDLVFDLNNNFLGMINSRLTNYEFETIGFSTNAKTLIDDRLNAENLRRIKRDDMVQHGIYFLNTQGLPHGGFIQMLDEIKDPLQAPRMYNPPIPNRPEVAKDNSGNYIVGSNKGYLIGELSTNDATYPYGRIIDRTYYGNASTINGGDWNIDPSSAQITVGDIDGKVLINRSLATNAGGTSLDYLSIGDNLFYLENVSIVSSGTVNIGIISNIQTNYNGITSAIATGYDTITVARVKQSIIFSAVSYGGFLFGDSFDRVGNLGATTTRDGMLVVRGGNPSQFFAKGDIICREDSKILGTYQSCTDIDKGPRVGEYVITYLPVQGVGCIQSPTSSSFSDGERIYRFDSVNHHLGGVAGGSAVAGFINQPNSTSMNRTSSIWGGYVEGEDTSTQQINTCYHKGAIEFFGPTLFRYVDLQRGDYGSFNRLNKNKSYFTTSKRSYDKSSVINSYATAFKVRAGYSDEPILLPYGYNTQNERYDWLSNPENKEGPVMGSNITTFAKGNFIDSGFGAPKSHYYEQNDSIETGGLYAGSAFKTYSAWADTLEEIDTKALHWQIFSISDLYPESVYHSDNLGYVNSIHEFNEFSIILKGRSGTTSSGVKHQNYSGMGASSVITTDIIETLDIESSSINPRQIRRFGLLRLIEVTTDYLFNNVDGENVIKGASKTLPTYENSLQIPYLHLPILGTNKQLPTNNYHYGGYNPSKFGQNVKQNMVKTVSSGSIYSIDGNRPYLALDTNYPNLDFASLGQPPTGSYLYQEISTWRHQIFKTPNQIIANEQGWILGRYYLGGMYLKGRYEDSHKHSADDSSTNRSIDDDEAGLFTSINYLPLDVGFHVDEHTREDGSTTLPKAATYTLIDEGYLVKPTDSSYNQSGTLDYTTSLEGTNYMKADNGRFIALIGHHLSFGHAALSSEVTSVTTLGGNTLSQGDLLGCLDPDGVKKFLGEIDTIWEGYAGGQTCLYIRLQQNNRVPYNYTTPPVSGDGVYNGVGGSMQNTQQHVVNSPLYKITVNAPDVQTHTSLTTNVSYTMPITPSYTIQTNDGKSMNVHFGGGGDIVGYQTLCQIKGSPSNLGYAIGASNLHDKIKPVGSFDATSVNIFPLKPNMNISNRNGEHIGQLVYTGKYNGLVTSGIHFAGATVITMASSTANYGFQVYDSLGRNLGGIVAGSLVGNNLTISNPLPTDLPDGTPLYTAGVNNDQFSWALRGTGGLDTNKVALAEGEFVYISPVDNTEHSERFVWTYMLTKRTLSSNFPQYDTGVKGRDSIPLLEHFVVGKMGSFALISTPSVPDIQADWRPSLGLLGTSDGMYLGLDVTNNADGWNNNNQVFLNLEGHSTVHPDQEYLATGIGSWVTRNYRRGSFDYGQVTALDEQVNNHMDFLRYGDMNSMVPYAGVPIIIDGGAGDSTGSLPNVAHVTMDTTVSLEYAISSNNAKKKYKRFVEHVKNRGAYVITPICFSCDFQRYGAVNVSSKPNHGGMVATSPALQIDGHANTDTLPHLAISSNTRIFPASLTHYRRSAFQNKCDDPFSPSFMWGGVGGDGIDREGNLIIEESNLTNSRDASPAYQLRQPSRVLMRLSENNLLTALNYKTNNISNAGEANVGIYAGHSDQYSSDTNALEANPHKNVHEPFLYSSAIPVIVDSGMYNAENSQSSSLEKGMSIAKGGHYDVMFGGNNNVDSTKGLSYDESNEWGVDGSKANRTRNLSLGSPNFRRLYTQPYLWGNRTEGNTTLGVSINQGLIPIVTYNAFNVEQIAIGDLVNAQYNGYPTYIFARGFQEGNRSSAGTAYASKASLNKYQFLGVNVFTSLIDNWQLDWGKESTKTTISTTIHAYTKQGLVYFNWMRGSFNYGDGTSTAFYHNINPNHRFLPIDPNPEFDAQSFSTSYKETRTHWNGAALLPYTITYYQHHYGNSIGTITEVKGGSESRQMEHQVPPIITDLITDNHSANVALSGIGWKRQPFKDFGGSVFNSQGGYDSEEGSNYNYGKTSAGIYTSEDASQFNKRGTFGRNRDVDISGITKGASYNYKSASLLYKWRIHLFNDKSQMWAESLQDSGILPNSIETDGSTNFSRWDGKDGAREESVLSPKTGAKYQVVRFYTTDWNNLASSNGSRGYTNDEQRRVAGFLNFFPDLTGYYLASEEGVNNDFDGLSRNSPFATKNYSYQKMGDMTLTGNWENTGKAGVAHHLEEELYMDIEGSKPNYIHKVHYHEVHLDRDVKGGFETGKKYIHTLVIDNMHCETINNPYSYVGNYRIMRPAEVCLHRNTPTEIPLYTMSKTTTKQSGSSEMYDLNVRAYTKQENYGDSNQTPENEGIFSMYLPVSTDGPTQRTAYIKSDGVKISYSGATSHVSSPENTMIQFIEGTVEGVAITKLATDPITYQEVPFNDIFSNSIVGKSRYGQRLESILKVTYIKGTSTKDSVVALIKQKSSDGFDSVNLGVDGSVVFTPTITQAIFTNARENAFVTSRTPSDLFEEVDLIDRAWTNNISYDVLMTDGVTKLNTNLTVNYDYRRQNSKKESKFVCSLKVDSDSFNKMAGIVSIGEVFSIVTSLSPSVKNIQSASIGSTLAIGEESLDAVKRLLVSENIDFVIPSNDDSTYFSLSTFKNNSLPLAIDGLLQNKNMKLYVNNQNVSLKKLVDSSDKTNIVINALSVKKMGILVSSKKESLFKKYNEVIVQGLQHKVKKINGSSIKKYGKMTLQEYDSTLSTKSEVIRKANQLLELHSKEQLRIFMTMDIRTSKGLSVGNLIKINLPQQGILNDEYRIMKMVYNSSETTSLELGSADNSLASMIAHSLLAKDKVTGDILPQTKVEGNEPLDVFENVKVKELRLVIKKHSYSFPNTGVLVNIIGGYSSGSFDTIIVDGVDATTKFSDGDRVYTSNNLFVGEVESVTTTLITLTQLMATSLVDDEQLWNGGAVGTIGFNTPIGYHTPIGFQAATTPIHTEEILVDIDLTRESEALI